jgi:hypothetical protein
MRFSTSGFFHESVSAKPLSIPLGPFQFFRKFAEIFTVQRAPPVSLTLVANEKSSSRKIVIILFRYLWGEELTNIYFCLQVHFIKGVSSLILFPLFAIVVNKTSRTGGKICRCCH